MRFRRLIQRGVLVTLGLLVVLSAAWSFNPPEANAQQLDDLARALIAQKGRARARQELQNLINRLTGRNRDGNNRRRNQGNQRNQPNQPDQNVELETVDPAVSNATNIKISGTVVLTEDNKKGIDGATVFCIYDGGSEWLGKRFAPGTKSADGKELADTDVGVVTKNGGAYECDMGQLSVDKVYVIAQAVVGEKNYWCDLEVTITQGNGAIANATVEMYVDDANGTSSIKVVDSENKPVKSELRRVFPTFDNTVYTTDDSGFYKPLRAGYYQAKQTGGDNAGITYVNGTASETIRYIVRGCKPGVANDHLMVMFHDNHSLRRMEPILRRAAGLKYTHVLLYEKSSYRTITRNQSQNGRQYQIDLNKMIRGLGMCPIVTGPFFWGEGIAGEAIPEAKQLFIGTVNVQGDRRKYADLTKKDILLRVWSRQLEQIKQVYGDDVGILFSDDEIFKLPNPKGNPNYTCRLCTGGEVISDSHHWAAELTRNMLPKSEIYVWSDMFSPFENGTDDRSDTRRNRYFKDPGSMRGSWEWLKDPVNKDVIIFNWTSTKPFRIGSVKHFADLGVRQVIAGAYVDTGGSGIDPDRLIQCFNKKAREMGVTLYGAMYSIWSDSLGPYNRREFVEWSQNWRQKREDCRK